MLVLGLLVAVSAAGLAASTHTVEKGENLVRIARRYGTTPAALAQANGLSNPNLIVIGQLLTIPGAPAPQGAAPAPPPALAEHRVARGENLTVIAARYGTTAGRLAELNGLRAGRVLRAGQVLKVPAPPAPTPPSVEELLVRYAREYRVDPALVKAVAWQESGWKQEVVSPAGAIGVMQVMPASGQYAGERLLGRPVDLTKLEDNVRAGVRFLAFLIERAGGDETLAVAGYFQGLRSVRTQGMSPRTQRYVANVMALRKRFAA